MTAGNVIKLVNLNALIYVTLEILLVAMAVYRELLSTHFLLFLLPSIYVPVLSVVAAPQTKSWRWAAISFVLAAMGSTVGNLIFIAVGWYRKGIAYLGLAAVTNGFVALWVIIFAMLALVINGAVAVFLLLELNHLEHKTK
jgi:hypothetical protein